MRVRSHVAHRLRVDADRATIAQLKADAQRVDDTYDDRLASLKRQLQRDQELRIQREQQSIEGFDKRVAREKSELARRLSNAELRLRADEESLLEVTRVETERGGSAQAVQLGVFPAAD